MTTLRTEIKDDPIDGVSVVVIALRQAGLELDITPKKEELVEMFEVIGRYLRQRKYFSCPLMSE